MKKFVRNPMFKVALSVILVVSLMPAVTWAGDQFAGPDAKPDSLVDEESGLPADLAYIVDEANNPSTTDEGGQPADNVAVPIEEGTVLSDGDIASQPAVDEGILEPAVGGEAVDGQEEASGMKAIEAEEEEEAADEDAEGEGVWVTGKKRYETLSAAVEAAEDGGTIKLAADAADDVATTISGKALTIDLGGHTVSGKNISNKSIISLFDGASLSISNGTMRDGVSSWSWGSHAYRDNNAGAIAAERSTLNISNMTFLDNKESRSSSNSATDVAAWDCALAISNCTFTNSALIDKEHVAVCAERGTAVIDGCTFTNVYRALYTSNCASVDVKNSSFSNYLSDGERGIYTAFVNLITAGDSTQYINVTGCTFEDINIHSNNYFTNVLYIEALGDAQATIKGCTFKNNSVLDSNKSQTHYIVKAAAKSRYTTLDLTVEDSLFTGNYANLGTLYLGTASNTTVRNTVIKDNTARGYENRTEFAGGLVLQGKSLTLENSAIYNNSVEIKSDFSPAKAEDVFVYKNASINASSPEAFVDFTDPGHDFSGLVWKDGAVSGFEKAPARTNASDRYYTISDVKDLVVAKIGEEMYGSLEDAFAAAAAGDTIEVVTDSLKVSVKSPIAVDEDVTLALEDHNVVYAPENGEAAPLFTVKDGATFTLTNVQSERYNINSNGSTDVEGGIESGKMVVEAGGRAVLSDAMLTDGIVNNGQLAFDAVQKKADIALGSGKFVALGEAYDTATFKDSKLSFTLDAGVAQALNDEVSDDVTIATGGNDALLKGITVAGITSAAVNKKLANDSIVLHVGEALYLDGVKGSDEADGTTAATAVKTFTEASKRIEANSKIDTIIVVGTVTVADEQTWTLPEGASVVRDNDFRNQLVTVAAGGSLSLSNITLDGKLVAAAAPLIKVKEGGKLEIANGTTLRNNINHANNFRYGGAIDTEGHTVMTGGTISDNEATHGAGVSIYGDNAVFDFLGGTITRNAATDSGRSSSYGGDGVGGGVCIDAGATMNMGTEASGARTMDADTEGPAITKNTSSRSGGGISVGTSRASSSPKHAVLNMYNGVIDSNSTVQAGGGIFIQDSAEGYVYAGAITNNRAGGSNAYFGGGGIYVNGLHSTAAWTGDLLDQQFAAAERGQVHGYLYIENVEITGNTADWLGGAVGGCITSQTIIGEATTAIHDNTSNNNTLMTGSTISGDGSKVEVFYSKLSFWGNRSIDHAPAYLTQYMIGGGEYNWYDARTEEPLSGKTLLNNREFTVAATDATAGDADVERARAGAKVLIANNYSGSNAGGIGTNGIVEIGKVAPKVDVSVSKVWDDEAAGKTEAQLRPIKLKYKLYRAAGEGADKELVDEVIVEAKEIETEEDGEELDNAKIEELDASVDADEGEATEGEPAEPEVKLDYSFAYTWTDLIKHVPGTNESVEYIYTVEEDLEYETITADGTQITVGDNYEATVERGATTQRSVDVPAPGEAYDVVDQDIQSWTITNTYTEKEEEEEETTETETPTRPNTPGEEEEEETTESSTPPSKDTPVKATPNTSSTSTSTPSKGKSPLTSDTMVDIALAAGLLIVAGAGIYAGRRRTKKQ